MTITRILSNYFFYLIHPFKVQSSFSVKRNKKLVLLDNDILGQNRELSFHEALSVSWIFVIINGIYSLMGVLFSRTAFLKFGKSDLMAGLISESILGAHRASIFISLVMIIFFPLIAFILIKYWELIIKACNEIFGKTNVGDRSIEQVTVAILPAYAFLSIPIFGDTFKVFAMMLYLFAGLKNNLNYSALQSLVVLLSPLLFIFTLFAILLMFFAFIIFGI